MSNRVAHYIKNGNPQICKGLFIFILMSIFIAQIAYKYAMCINSYVRFPGTGV